MDDLRWSLPQELIDEVLDHLHDDLQSLKCCSLVSRHWRASCGHHLFHNLTLDSRNVTDFLALSENHNSSSFSTFFSRIKHLRLIEYWLLHYSAWVVEYSTEVHRFSSVASLCLHGIIWKDSASLIGFIRGFLHLKELEIHQNTLDSVEILFKAIDGFPLLNRLSFHKIEFKEQPRLPHHHFSSQEVHVRTLQFSEGSQDVLHNWLDLLGQRSLANITSLCVLDIKESYVESFGKVIRTLGPSIEHLEVGLYMRGIFAVKEGTLQ